MKTLLLTLVLCISATLSAQITGNIDGMITDSAGTALIGVKVDILNSAGAPYGRSSMSRAGGGYTLSSLGPGMYNVQYSYPGYCSVVLHGVRVTVDNDTEVNLRLHTCETKEIEVIQYERPFMNGSPRYLRGSGQVLPR